MNGTSFPLGGFGAREYGSLTGMRTPAYYPSDTTTTVEPTGLVLSVELVKKALVEKNADADDLIDLIIAGVTQQVENYLGRDLLSRTRKAVFFYPAPNVFIMPAPVTAITLVQALDDEGTATTLTLNTDYYVRGLADNVQLYGINTNGLNTLQVTFTTGYGAATSVPAVIRQAILQECSRQFKRRQDPAIESFNVVDSLAPETYSLLRSFIIRRP